MTATVYYHLSKSSRKGHKNFTPYSYHLAVKLLKALKTNPYGRGCAKTIYVDKLPDSHRIGPLIGPRYKKFPANCIIASFTMTRVHYRLREAITVPEKCQSRTIHPYIQQGEAFMLFDTCAVSHSNVDDDAMSVSRRVITTGVRIYVTQVANDILVIVR